MEFLSTEKKRIKVYVTRYDQDTDTIDGEHVNDFDDGVARVEHNYKSSTACENVASCWPRGQIG